MHHDIVPPTLSQSWGLEDHFKDIKEPGRGPAGISGVMGNSETSWMASGT